MTQRKYLSWIATLLITSNPFRVEGSVLEQRAACAASFTVCTPAGATASNEPSVGPALKNVFQEVVDTVNAANHQSGQNQKLRRDKSSFELDTRAIVAGANLCCASGTQCLLLVDLGLPFCYDTYTTNYFLPAGSTGQIASGEYDAKDGSSANLLSGDYSSIDGTAGNIYTGQDATAKPNTATMIIPTQYTSAGVGSAIPVTALGQLVHFLTTDSQTSTAPTSVAQETPQSLVDSPASTTSPMIQVAPTNSDGPTITIGQTTQMVPSLTVSETGSPSADNLISTLAIDSVISTSDLASPSSHVTQSSDAMYGRLAAQVTYSTSRSISSTAPIAIPVQTYSSGNVENATMQIQESNTSTISAYSTAIRLQTAAPIESVHTAPSLNQSQMTNDARFGSDPILLSPTNDHLTSSTHSIASVSAGMSLPSRPLVAEEDAMDGQFSTDLSNEHSTVTSTRTRNDYYISRPSEAFITINAALTQDLTMSLRSPILTAVYATPTHTSNSLGKSAMVESVAPINTSSNDTGMPQSNIAAATRSSSLDKSVSLLFFSFALLMF